MEMSKAINIAHIFQSIQNFAKLWLEVFSSVKLLNDSIPVTSHNRKFLPASLDDESEQPFPEPFHISLTDLINLANI